MIYVFKTNIGRYLAISANSIDDANKIVNNIINKKYPWIMGTYSSLELVNVGSEILINDFFRA